MIVDTKSLIAASVAAFAVTGASHATLWDQGGGADTSYTNPLNWAGDTIPLATFVEIKDSTDVVTIDTATTGGRTFIENKPTINVEADVTFSGGSMNVQSVDWNQSAGTVTYNQSGALPFGSVSSLTADLTMTGGAFHVNGAGQTTAITNVFGTAIETGQASGNLDISMILGNDGGGAANISMTNAEMKTRVGVALAGGSSFSVVGSGNTISIGELASFAGSWYQAAGAELSFAADAGGVSTIRIDQGTDASRPVKHVAFEDGAVLDLSFDGIVPPVATTTYELIRFENGDIKDDQTGLGGTGLVFAGGVDPNWEITVDNTGADGLLLATYVVPEPGTIGLLIAGGALVLRRRA